MIRLFLWSIIGAVFIVATSPGVFAAYDSVTFTQDTTVYLSDLGINLVVVAGSRVSQMHVMPRSVEFILDAGSQVTVRSYDLYSLDNAVKQTTCGGEYSEVYLPSDTWKTLLIAPSLSRCSGSSGGGQAVRPAPSQENISSNQQSSPTFTTSTISAIDESGGGDSVHQLRLQLIALLKQLIELLMLQLQLKTSSIL